MFSLKNEALAFADAGNGMWYGGVQSRGERTFDILGDTFLKSVYAVSTFQTNQERRMKTLTMYRCSMLPPTSLVLEHSSVVRLTKAVVSTGRVDPAG
jgi:hypothetical protein